MPRYPRTIYNYSARIPDILSSDMKTGKYRRIIPLSLLVFVFPVRLDAQGLDYYQPNAVRLEIPQSWEKTSGLPLRENVAGIYELDYRRCDFKNNIAITIDDCAPNQAMATDLDILKNRGIKAVFFIIGRNFVDASGKPMPRAKELLSRVVEEGHVIGNHSYWHKRLDLGGYRDGRAALTREIDDVQSLVDRILGYHYPLIYFRPPDGAHSTPEYMLDKVLRDKKEYLTNWTITSFDWCMRLPPGRPDHLGCANVIARTLKQAKEESGGVLLLHAFPETTAILDGLLAQLSSASNKRGSFTFSTLDQILRLKYGG